LKAEVLLITPPLTQLNTPYPGTAYLNYFLRSQHYTASQFDLGLDLILSLFSSSGLKDLFDYVENSGEELPLKAKKTLALRQDYQSCVDAVILFLQNKDLTLAQRIFSRTYLPEGERFKVLEELNPEIFGRMAVQDFARFLATLFLEDLGDFIRDNVDEGFGFSRYQEKISVAASSFDYLDNVLQSEASFLDLKMLKILEEKLTGLNPQLIALSIPFPGNLYGGLKCAQYLGERFSDCAIVLGGGYVNTELRELCDPRLFDYVDFVCLDDGELPLIQILKVLEGENGLDNLSRTFLLNDDREVEYVDACKQQDFSHLETGVPDYTGLDLSNYLSIIELANPMHRLWNDGRWNKMTLAHGCYWKRCSFCDVTLDYIERYDEAPAKVLVDRMERLMVQTGVSGFHFVDEAAPPSLLQDLAEEILSRDIKVSWWTNVRFERAFTKDLCRLLSAAGCIAVSGGLEVASERLLRKMKKGTGITQVCQSSKAFSDAGIMVHAYLMYGFPTETAQETVDSLEVVRQLFKENMIDSGFWHRFALTAHSPIGKDPDSYDVKITGPEFEGFAKNELSHDDPLGCDHDVFSDGLKKALFNYMHGLGLDENLQCWFNSSIPETIHAQNLIRQRLQEFYKPVKVFDKDRVLWLGGEVLVDDLQQTKCQLTFISKTKELSLTAPAQLAEWLYHLLPQLRIENDDAVTYGELKAYYAQYFEDDFDSMKKSQFWQSLEDFALIYLRRK
jgi:hypothetical protein